MDDILHKVESNKCDEKLQKLNDLHPKLKFTIEREVNGELAVLDMKLNHNH